MPNIDVDVKKKVLWKQKNNIIVLCGNFEFRGYRISIQK
jgi:hypothetical protein